MLQLVKIIARCGVAGLKAACGAAGVRVARQFCSWPGLILSKLTHLELTSFL